MKDKIRKLLEELPDLKLSDKEVEQLTGDAEAFDTLLRTMDKLDLTGITPQTVVSKRLRQ